MAELTHTKQKNKKTNNFWIVFRDLWLRKDQTNKFIVHDAWCDNHCVCLVSKVPL